MTKRDSIWAIMCVAAIAIGYFLGSAGIGEQSARRSGPRRPIEPTATGARASESHTATPAQGPPSVTGQHAMPENGAKLAWERLVGRPPTAKEWDRIRQGADAQRAQLNLQVERAAIAEASRLAREWIEEQKRMADAERGGTMALLRGLREKPARLPTLVADPAAFQSHFTRSAAGPRVDGAAVSPEDPPADGTTLEFAAGVYVLDTRRLFSHSRPFPKDLLIVGLGMNETLVRIDEISANDEVTSLTFRDLTLDCNNNYMTDLRSQNPATIRLEQCRVIGFDMGAGGSVMFAASNGAFYASDCEFAAGYSRTRAGYGNLFRVRSGLLVRMERCRFIGPFRSVFASDPAATYHFDHCEFEDRQALLGQCKSDPRKGVTFEDCTQIEIPKEPNSIVRSFADLNPAWPKRNR